MNRMLLLGVVGGVLSSTAWGQSSVTIYGIVDAAVQHTSFSRSGADALNSVNSGHRAGSRLGFRGAEDLGDGFRAIFQLEQGLNVDTGTLGQGGRAFGRQAYAGLDGAYGTLVLGRVSTFDGGAFDMFTPIDPFIAGYGVATLASTFSAAGGLRVDNAVLYRTPQWGGLQAGAIHSVQANGQEAVGANIRFDHLGVNYKSGPVYATLLYSKAEFPSSKNYRSQQMAYAGASYDFKVLKLHAAYGIEKGVRSDLLSAVGATADGTAARSWMLGATVPLGSPGSRLFADVQKRDGKTQTIGPDTFDADRTVYAVGYDYYLSKRSILFVSAAKAKGSGTLAPTRAATDFANKTEFTVGMSHFF